MSKTKYHTVSVCMSCNGKNKLINSVYENGYMCETATVCESCGLKGYWAYGFFEQTSLAGFPYTKIALGNGTSYVSLALKLKSVRNDLTDKQIKAGVRKIHMSSITTVTEILERCIRLACENKPMPWENSTSGESINVQI